MTAWSRSSRLRLLAALWMAIGTTLVARGLPYAGLVPADGVDGLSGRAGAAALALAAALGILKGVTVMRHAGLRAAARIDRQAERAPPWTILSARMLLLVALMVASGLALRLLPYDPQLKAWIVAVVYPGVGVALLVGGAWVATTRVREDP